MKKKEDKTKWFNEIENIKILYFAYGSNINGPQMQKRCPGSTPLGIARCINYKFIINTQGVASIIQKRNSKVYGILWNINNANLNSLDKYEGLEFGTYTRKKINIVLEKKLLSAQVYIASNSEIGKSGKKYTKTIIDGINYFNSHQSWREEIWHYFNSSENLINFK